MNRHTERQTDSWQCSRMLTVSGLLTVTETAGVCWVFSWRSKGAVGGGDWLLNRVRALLALLLMMLVQIYLFTDVFVSHLLCAVVLSVLNVAFQFKYVNVDHYWFYISWCFFLFTRGRFNPKKCNDINDNSLHCRSFTQGKVREGHEQWTPVMDELTVNNKTQCGRNVLFTSRKHH